MKKNLRWIVLFCVFILMKNTALAVDANNVSAADSGENGGKKYSNIQICVFGDSIMYGAGNNETGPMDMLAASYGFDIRKWATSGAVVAWQAWAGESDDEAYRLFNIRYQIEASVKAGDSPDIIVMNGRTNDLNWYENEDGSWSLGKKLGKLSDADDFSGNYDRATFIGGLETIFYTFRAAWPDAKVLYVIDFDMAGTDKDETLEFTDALINTAEKWNIETVDLYHEKFNTREEQYVCYTNPTEAKPDGDTTHPTGEGYRFFYVPLLEQKLTALMDAIAG